MVFGERAEEKRDFITRIRRETMGQRFSLRGPRKRREISLCAGRHVCRSKAEGKSVGLLRLIS